jgi:uncharacterized glyoxalase superfamily protein PhnB
MVPWATFDRRRFSVTEGDFAEYRSSPEVFRGFCANCGTSLTYRHERRVDEIDVALGTLDDPTSLRPAAHIWVRDELPWLPTGDGLPRFSTTVEEGARRVNAAPAGFHAVTPRIVARDAKGLVGFVRHVFGATGDYEEQRPSMVRIGDSVLLISEAGERRPMAAFLYVYVADTDAAHRRALEAGARSIEEPAVVEYGDRRSMIEDPWGNTWQIAMPPSDA